MTRILTLALVVALAGCASVHPDGAPRAEPLTPTDAHQVDALLDDLYASFCSAEGDEPDWDLMRSAFVDDAQFVTESGSPWRESFRAGRR